MSASTGIGEDRGGPTIEQGAFHDATTKAYVGVDWASATHQVCVLDFSSVPHTANRSRGMRQ